MQVTSLYQGIVDAYTYATQGLFFTSTVVTINEGRPMTLILDILIRQIIAVSVAALALNAFLG